MKRLFRHLQLATLCIMAAAVAGILASGDPLDAISLTTAWLCLLLLAAALLVGPLHVLRTGRVLGNHLLRRDFGIWAAINGLVHLGLAFTISMTPAYMQIHVDGADSWPSADLRRDLYTWAVVASLVIAALFLMLLALSSNRAINLVGMTWWKRLQRSSYLAFALTVAHGVAFQVIEGRTAWLVALLVLLTVAVLVLQLRGWARMRQSALRPTGRM